MASSDFGELQDITALAFLVNDRAEIRRAIRNMKEYVERCEKDLNMLASWREATSDQPLSNFNTAFDLMLPDIKMAHIAIAAMKKHIELRERDLETLVKGSRKGRQNDDLLDEAKHGGAG